VADLHHGLAADYDWIFEDRELAGGAAINQPATARLLQRVGPGGDVLDAACGTGIDAAVLARRGFSWCTPLAATRWSRRWPGCGGWHVPEGTW
jgi:ubiquinone/menaquinone biosynthesis C-methylase UbiE